jgi:glycosyltransferase involved in cell wall biosynthesis
MVSTDIRRDLIEPLRHFSRLQITHYYRRASYGDLTADELDGSLIHYHSPMDLYRGLQQTRPEIIQGVEPFAVRLLPYVFSGWRAARRLHARLVIVTLENRPLPVKHGRSVAWLLRLALRPVFDDARLIIPLNEGAARNVLTVGPFSNKLQRLMYGTWGVDLSEFTPRRDGREPDFGGSQVLLFAGRLHLEKGIFDLLDAFALVRERAGDVQLLIVGDGAARSAVEQLVQERGWRDVVHLTGTVKNRDLPPYFRAADVFVAPSITTRKWEEQVGMTNIQAMACGVPVVSTRSGAIPEYVPDGVAGTLVAERAPHALADAILQLLSDQPLRQRLGRGGRMYAEMHYSAIANILRAEGVILERCLGL